MPVQGPGRPRGERARRLRGADGRGRAIAHALVETNKDLQVLILSGSPIIGNFDFRSRVDFIRVPGVIKLRNGEYTALNLHIDTEQVLEMRASIMRHTAEIFGICSKC